MSNSRYSSDSYETLKILQCPIEIDLADGTPGDVLAFTSTEAMNIVEFGIITSEVVASDATDAVIALKEGSTELGTLTVPDETATGVNVKDVETITAIGAGDTLVFNLKTAGDDSGTQSGKGYAYIKYKDVYSG